MIVIRQSPTADTRPPTCRECGCQTGGGDYCYQHKPYTVWPQKDGSFLTDSRGSRKRVWVEPPADALMRTDPQDEL